MGKQVLKRLLGIKTDRPLILLGPSIRTPPFSVEARMEAGELLRDVQDGENVGLPHSRPMGIIGKRCHEMRIVDEDKTWRIIYRIDPDAVLIADIFAKKRTKHPSL